MTEITEVTQLIVGVGTSSAPIQAATSGTARPSDWLVDWVQGEQSDSGILMNVQRALSYAPVFQAVSVLGGDIGQLPLDLIKRVSERNKVKAREHHAFGIMRNQSNPFMSAATFRETMMLHALLTGNGVAEIQRDGRGRPVWLWPLVPHNTSVEIVDGQLWYLTRIGEETVQRRLRPENVLHIRNFGWEGIWGQSTIDVAKNSWGLGLAGEKYANRYFKNNGRPSGVVKHPGKLNDTAYNRLKRDWRDTHEGLDNAARVAILEEGAEYQATAFNQRESQWVESREKQREEVAGWFGLPPSKLGVLHESNFSNMVEQARAYFATGLRRWQIKWQDESNWKLLTKKERETYFYEFNNDALLQADTKTRYEAYTSGLGGHPFLQVNEVRGKENLDSVEGGDVIPEPLNMNPQRDGAEGGKESDRSGTPNAMADKITSLLENESRRVTHAAKSATNFVEWLEAFYTEWPATVAAATTVPLVTAETWAAESKEICLTVAGKATKGQLHGMIAASAMAWSSRAVRYSKNPEGDQ